MINSESKSLKMTKIRTILQTNDHKRGTKDLQVTRRVEFDHICAVGLFTADGCFCSQFQKDLRDSQSGCKWSLMEGSFRTALKSLHFAQKIGNSQSIQNANQIVRE